MWLGKIGGLHIGIITNNGPITPQGAAKAAQFIHLCEQTNRPLLFLHNTTGFMVGTDAEQNGIIKHGSKLIQAVANCTVPKISIVVAGSYGAGNYAMCGRSLSPDFIFGRTRMLLSWDLHRPERYCVLLLKGNKSFRTGTESANARFS